jgi:hypothetical protein
MRITHDEDIAQAARMVVLDKLPTFVRADPAAFSRWVRSIFGAED